MRKITGQLQYSDQSDTLCSTDYIKKEIEWGGDGYNRTKWRVQGTGILDSIDKLM